MGRGDDSDQTRNAEEATWMFNLFFKGIFLINFIYFLNPGPNSEQ